MDIVTRPYFWIESGDLKSESGSAVVDYITCAKNVDSIDSWALKDDIELKKIDDLVNACQKFCNNLKELNTPYVRQAYQVALRRCVYVFLPGRRIECFGENKDVFYFVFNKTDKLTYTSNIRDVLNTDFKNIYVENPNYIFDGKPYMPHNESAVKPETPLYVKKYDAENVWVAPIKDHQFVVNKNLHELHPRVTGECPARLLNLLKRRTEDIRLIKKPSIVR